MQEQALSSRKSKYSYIYNKIRKLKLNQTIKISLNVADIKLGTRVLQNFRKSRCPNGRIVTRCLTKDHKEWSFTRIVRKK